MLMSCKYCGGVHKKGFICSKKPLKKQVKEPTTANKFRSTRNWSNKSKEIRKRDLYLCQYCLTDKKYTFNQLEVHHITKLCESWEKRLDNDNLITLCAYHHKMADNGEIEKELLMRIATRNEANGVELKRGESNG